MKIEAFTKTYGGRTVLSFPGGEFRPGTIIALLGPNGSGKSTFASVVSGVMPSDRGLPVVSGETAGYLPQRPYAFHMSLKNNLLLNGEGSNDQKNKRALMLMDSLSLTPLAGKTASSFSGGETARMALARLFMKRYSLVLLDEPCAAMDIRSTFQAEDLIRAYREETGCIIFLITHSYRQALRLADEVLFLKDGRLLERGAPQKVLEQPDDPEVREILEF